MFCPNCGVQLVSDTTPFCTQCGVQVKASAQAPVQAVGVAPASVPATSSGKKWLIAGGLILLFLVLFGVMIALRIGAGGGSFPSMDSAVNTVRNGVLKDYNTATVGKAFEGTFQDAKWRSFETPKGQTIVEFKGTMKLPELMQTFGGSPACEKQVAKFRNECIASKPISDMSAAIPQAEVERLSKSGNDLLARRNALIPAVKNPVSGLINQPATERQIKMVDWCHFGGNEAACKEFFRSFSFPSPQAEQEFYALTDELNASAKQYNEQLATVTKQKEDLDHAIASCVETQSASFMMPVTFQFTLSADKQSFEITYTDLGQLNLAAIYR
jgi:hypothetical protein